MADSRAFEPSSPFPRSARVGTTVSELIAALQQIEGNLLVVLPGQEGGFAPLRLTQILRLQLFANTDPLFGPHDLAVPEEECDCEAVALLPATPPGSPARAEPD